MRASPTEALGQARAAVSYLRALLDRSGKLEVVDGQLLAGGVACSDMTELVEKVTVLTDIGRPTVTATFIPDSDGIILGERNRIRAFDLTTGEDVGEPIKVSGLRSFLSGVYGLRWLAAGPTHHFALGLGNHAETIQHIAEALRVECEVVSTGE